MGDSKNGGFPRLFSGCRIGGTSPAYEAEHQGFRRLIALLSQDVELSWKLAVLSDFRRRIAYYGSPSDPRKRT
jgi:hypothetical protein